MTDNKNIFDLHMHPVMKSYMFGRKFSKQYSTPEGTSPFTMRVTLDRLLEGGVKTVLSSIYVWEKDLFKQAWPLHFIRKFFPKLDLIFKTPPDEMCRIQLDHQKEMIEDTKRLKGDVIDIAKSYSDMERIVSEGKICFVNSIEGAHVLNGNLDNLDNLYERGVAHMVVPHFYPNEAGYPADSIPSSNFLRKLGMLKEVDYLNQGLTRFGRDLIDKMFDIGMLVDVCHGTPLLRKQVYEMAQNNTKKRPVIMSHTGLYELAPYSKNATNSDIRHIADTGGVLGLIMMTWWLQKPETKVCKDAIIHSIDHLIKYGGEDCVAFGSDFDGFTSVPDDFTSPSDYNYLRRVLDERYTEKQVEKFLYGNAARALKEGWG
ncbi:dipeptidase [Thermoproteota archaeon]